MKLNKYIIALIFVILLSRFIFEFSTPEFSNGKSYFYIKQIESIKDTGKVSQTEAQNINLLTLSPLFSYLLVPFSIFGNWGIKIFISLLIVFAAIVLFYFSKLFCKDEKICFISTLLFSFSPVLFKITLNKISLIPIILFLFYLHVDACGQIQFSQCVNCLCCRAYDIYQPLMRLHLELLSGLFIYVRRS